MLLELFSTAYYFKKGKNTKGGLALKHYIIILMA